ncbi:MAG: hypothetical protein II367_05395 [Treponema sp.]|nr:hypothetical protein [Treponema sp.]
MNTLIKEVFVKTLKEKLNDIDVGNSEIEEEQALEILKLIAHEPVSKERAAIELGISPSRFDKLVEEKKLPKGKKKLGWKELRYYLDEIIEAGKKYKIGKFKK